MIVPLLLADVNRSDAYGRTPLHLAAAVDYGTMVEYLIENGADVKQATIIEGKGGFALTPPPPSWGNVKCRLTLK